ncbi:hypothetical protein Tco_1183920 [Tanacetum coccineum]
MTAEGNFESESDTKEQPFEKITFNIDYKIKTSLEEPPSDVELKPLPDNLEYVFLEEPSFLHVIISSQLSEQNKNKLISVLKRHKQAIAWKTTDIPVICPSFCKHKIQLLDDKKPVVQKQRRLNPNMQEVVKKEIVKLLETGIIYPITDSPLVSPIQCVPKKGGITVVTNEKDELVPTRTVMGYFQIPIDPMDKEKITFTCPFGTYAYRRMPFGLCNAHATFQSLNWNLPFELMCDASDFAIGEVLEFDIKIKDKKGTKKVSADHLSRIDNDETSDDSDVDDNFPKETLMEITTNDTPWLAEFANYLVGDIITKGMTY